MTVAAGVVADAEVSTAIALIDMAAELGGTAGGNGIESLVLR